MRTSVLVGYIKCRSQVLTVPHYTTSVVTHSAHKENRSGRVSKRAPTCATSRPARTHARLHACASSHRLRLRPLSPSHPPLAPRCAAMRPPAFAPPTVVAAPPPRPPPATAAGACRWHRCYRRRRCTLTEQTRCCSACCRMCTGEAEDKRVAAQAAGAAGAHQWRACLK